MSHETIDAHIVPLADITDLEPIARDLYAGARDPSNADLMLDFPSLSMTLGHSDENAVSELEENAAGL